MISPKSTVFKYTDNSMRHTTVLLPGWATDYRVFGSLNLNSNYLIPVEFAPFAFERVLLEALKENNISKISLFGVSLGGFVATEFASKHADLVDELTLVGIRKKYRQEGLDEVRTRLKKNKKAYLHGFYNQCFSKTEKMSLSQGLLRDYCEEFKLGYLLSTLDYLECAEIKPEELKKIKNIKIVHGKDDKIAPIGEAIDIKNSLKEARFICIENAGHSPFLKEGFNQVYYEK